MLKLKPSDTFTIVKDGVEIQFEVAEEGGYVVSVPELPGCITEGDTFEEAVAMIEDAMQGWLASAAKHGDPFPERWRPSHNHSGESRIPAPGTVPYPEGLGAAQLRRPRR